MKNLLISFASLLVFGFVGCGGDDGPVIPPQPTTPIVTVATGTTAPNMASTTDSVWNRITPKAVSLSSNSFASVIRQPGALSLPGSIAVQAVAVDDTLYVRVVWTDDSPDFWPGQYRVTSFDILGADTLAHFTRDDLSFSEDQLMLLFRPSGEVSWDVWNWRVITTGLGGLAEGYNWTGTALNRDAGNNPVAYINDSFGQPLYMFEGSPGTQSPYMFVADTVPLVANTDSAAWELDDLLPGWYINDSLALPENVADRGSRFDVSAIGNYDHGAAEYEVVLKRAFNTGNGDDLNLAAYQTVDLRVGIADNADFTLSTLYTRQGFTGRIIFTLP